MLWLEVELQQSFLTVNFCFLDLASMSSEWDRDKETAAEIIGNKKYEQFSMVARSSELRNCADSRNHGRQQVLYSKNPGWHQLLKCYEDMLNDQNKKLATADLGWYRQVLHYCGHDEGYFRRNLGPYNSFARHELFNFADKNNRRDSNIEQIRELLNEMTQSAPFIHKDDYEPRTSDTEKKKCIKSLTTDESIIVLSIQLFDAYEGQDILTGITLLMVGKGYYGQKLESAVQNLPDALVEDVFFCDEQKAAYFVAMEKIALEVDEVKAVIAERQERERTERERREREKKERKEHDEAELKEHEERERKEREERDRREREDRERREREDRERREREDRERREREDRERREREERDRREHEERERREREERERREREERDRREREDRERREREERDRREREDRERREREERERREREDRERRDREDKECREREDGERAAGAKLNNRFKGLRMDSMRNLWEEDQIRHEWHKVEFIGVGRGQVRKVTVEIRKSPPEFMEDKS